MRVKKERKNTKSKRSYRDLFFTSLLEKNMIVIVAAMDLQVKMKKEKVAKIENIEAEVGTLPSEKETLLRNANSQDRYQTAIFV